MPKPEDIRPDDAFSFEPDEGQIWLGHRQQRMLLFRQHAFGELRRLLFKRFGEEQAKRCLFQFGFRCGLGDYKTLSGIFPFEDEDEKLELGPRMHALEGIVLVESEKPTIDRTSGKFHFKGLWKNSYEAEVHKTMLGSSDSPVCFSLAGYGSGWCTGFFGKKVLEIERKCVGKGDSDCEWEIKAIDDWGSEADEWKSLLDESDDIYQEVEEEVERESERRASWKNRFADEAESIVGSDPKLLESIEQAEAAARANDPKVTVLIRGESGTGKEVVAKRIHQESGRNIFVAVNCAELNPERADSALFGHEKGAFTGATESRAGYFRSADKGTLFLDEVADLPRETQSKLLRVLDDQQVRPVGSSEETISVNVLVVAATNCNLKQATETGAFRDDLYQRLTTFEITLPPLRERQDTDIEELAQYFLDRQNKRHGKNLEIMPATIDAMKQYSWPGTIRELSRLMNRAVIHAGGTVINLNLPQDKAPADDSSPPKKFSPFHEVERAYIVSVLEVAMDPRKKTNWCVSVAAKMLEMNPNTLRNRMKKLGIPLPKDLGR